MTRASKKQPRSRVVVGDEGDHTTIRESIKNLAWILTQSGDDPTEVLGQIVAEAARQALARIESHCREHLLVTAEVAKQAKLNFLCDMLVWISCCEDELEIGAILKAIITASESENPRAFLYAGLPSDHQSLTRAADVNASRRLLQNRIARKVAWFYPAAAGRGIGRLPDRLPVLQDRIDGEIVADYDALIAQRTRERRKFTEQGIFVDMATKKKYLGRYLSPSAIEKRVRRHRPRSRTK